MRTTLRTTKDGVTTAVGISLNPGVALTSRRCFAEGCSSATLSWPRVQELAFCAMVLDSVLNNRDYEGLEPELISDWRVHFAHACSQMRDLALEALRRASDMPVVPADAAPEIAELEHRLAPA